MVRRPTAREQLRDEQSLRQCIRPLLEIGSPGHDEIRGDRSPDSGPVSSSNPLIATVSGLNAEARYILPIYPFCIVLADCGLGACKEISRIAGRARYPRRLTAAFLAALFSRLSC